MHFCTRALIYLSLALFPALAQTPPAGTPAKPPAAPPSKPPAATPAPAATPPATVTPPKPAAPKPAAKAAPRPPAKKVDRRVTSEQIAKWLTTKIPDKTIARDIKARGIGDDINRAAIAQLQSQGAGPETITALLSFIPKAFLTVESEPSAEVFLDDQSAGQIDGSGILKFPALDPGPHSVRVTKPLRREFTQQVTLANNGQQTVIANLVWTIGYLTVDPKQPEARIEISGAGTYVGIVQQLPVSVGEHTVTVTMPYRKTVIVTANVKGGAQFNLPVKLEIDPSAIKTLHASITDTCRAKKFDTAENLIQDYLVLAPIDSDLQTCLSNAYLIRKEYDKFLTLAAKSLADGGEFTFPVLHVHGPRRKQIHEALLTITQNEVRYEPKGKCPLSSFSRLRKDAQWSLTPMQDKSSELELRLPEADARKKLLTMDFVDDEADRLTVIYRLATQGSAPAPTPAAAKK